MSIVSRTIEIYRQLNKESGIYLHTSDNSLEMLRIAAMLVAAEKISNATMEERDATTQSS